MSTEEVIPNYQPTQRELSALHKAGLTLEEALKFDLPSEEAVSSFNDAMATDFTALELMLMVPLSKDLSEDVLNNMLGSVYLGQIPSDFHSFRTELIERLERKLEGNPYPGRGFSVKQAREVIEWLKGQEITGDAQEYYTWLHSELKIRLKPIS